MGFVVEINRNLILNLKLIGSIFGSISGLYFGTQIFSPYYFSPNAFSTMSYWDYSPRNRILASRPPDRKRLRRSHILDFASTLVHRAARRTASGNPAFISSAFSRTAWVLGVTPLSSFSRRAYATKPHSCTHLVAAHSAADLDGAVVSVSAAMSSGSAATNICSTMCPSSSSLFWGQRCF